MRDNKPLVSAAELEALMQGWGSGPQPSPDKFFPVRCWFLWIVSGAHAGWLLFGGESLAMALTSDTEHLLRLGHFLYFRGWFIIAVVAIASYSYLRNWYPAIIFTALLLIACTNLISDLFMVFPERLASPTPKFTLLMLVRLTALWMLYLNIKNASRIPDKKDRFNILLPFRRESGVAG